jgi:dihydroneopterin aldolase/2-amino-4-hydroxy-6-hydroxymethyldihydropteridine diphosphokinase
MNYILGIGSNIGDLEGNLEFALGKIRDISSTVINNVSSFYRTKPWGYVEQDDFLNMAVSVISTHEPEEFMIYLQEIERVMGKLIHFKYGPRVIDIDILLCDDIIIDTKILKIPHPEMHKREFVLRPLCEIAPDVVHPVLNKSIRELLKEL